MKKVIFLLISVIFLEVSSTSYTDCPNEFDNGVVNSNFQAHTLYITGLGEPVVYTNWPACKATLQYSDTRTLKLSCHWKRLYSSEQRHLAWRYKGSTVGTTKLIEKYENNTTNNIELVISKEDNGSKIECVDSDFGEWLLILELVYVPLTITSTITPPTTTASTTTEPATTEPATTEPATTEPATTEQTTTEPATTPPATPTAAPTAQFYIGGFEYRRLKYNTDEEIYEYDYYDGEKLNLTCFSEYGTSYWSLQDFTKLSSYKVMYENNTYFQTVLTEVDEDKVLSCIYRTSHTTRDVKEIRLHLSENDAFYMKGFDKERLQSVNTTYYTYTFYAGEELDLHCLKSEYAQGLTVWTEESTLSSRTYESFSNLKATLSPEDDGKEISCIFNGASRTTKLRVGLVQENEEASTHKN